MIIGFRRKQPHSQELEVQISALNSPSSAGSTYVSATTSPNYCSDNSSPIPLSPIFSHEGFDSLSDNGNYRRNFIEQAVISEESSETVYLARHKLDNNLYIIKAFPIIVSIIDSFHDKELFQRINKVKQANCRHIMRYVTCWVESQEVDLVSVNVRALLYVQMEHVTGVRLCDWAKGDFKPEAGRRVIKQIGKAIRHLNQKGICHGNICDSNIFVDEHGSVTIGDFNFKGSCEDDVRNYVHIVNSVITSPEQEEFRNEILSQNFISRLRIN